VFGLGCTLNSNSFWFCILLFFEFTKSKSLFELVFLPPPLVLPKRAPALQGLGGAMYKLIFEPWFKFTSGSNSISVFDLISATPPVVAVTFCILIFAL